MKQKKQKYDCPNCAEEKVREMLGYDDESLEAEMEEAERAWEAEKAANPEIAAKVQLEADEGFDKLMAKIKERGIEPISEDEYKNTERKNVRKVKKLSRKGKKALILAAVVCVMALGMTMVVSARREFKYRIYPVQGNQNTVIRRSGALVTKVGKAEEAYIEIENTLEMKVLMLGHVLKEMTFKQVVIHEDHAVMEWKLGEKSIYFKESRVPIQRGFTGAAVSDRKVCDEVDNPWLGKTIAIEENILEDGLIEYSADINIDECYYYISGMVSQTEFIELVKGICYR